eukprot:TRINITY_DN1183_c0_g1_i1.p1 TRINITY_DN1183_c0_g1~~TRINITY_DN1183_c0_g1_i1.p1  ORF type:complete len:472 (-),score=74.29 TRINITY_DN1183_c0_g1_i1:71-1486(-)
MGAADPAAPSYVGECSPKRTGRRRGRRRRDNEAAELRWRGAGKPSAPSSASSASILSRALSASGALFLAASWAQAPVATTGARGQEDNTLDSAPESQGSQEWWTSEVEQNCSEDTYGTCYFLGCWSFRHARCDHGKCLCDEDSCAVAGVCVKKAPIRVKEPWPEKLPVELPTLDHFCETKVGPGRLLDCTCCGDRYTGDPVKSALMYFGGEYKLTKAMVVDRAGDAHFMGMVRTWSLGSKIPELQCAINKTWCRCAGQDFQTHGAWAENAPRCVTGNKCTFASRDMVIEGASARATRSEERKEEWPKPLGQAKQRVQLECGGGGDGPAGISIGLTRCEDMALSQCERFYSKSTGVWRKCQLVQDQPKICHARPMSKAEKLFEDDEVTKWSWTHTYRPDLPFKVTLDSDYQMNITLPLALSEQREIVQQRLLEIAGSPRDLPMDSFETPSKPSSLLGSPATLARTSARTSEM